MHEISNTFLGLIEEELAECFEGTRAMRDFMLLLGVHLSKCLGVPLGHKDGVPPKVGLPPRRQSDFPLTPTCEQPGLCLWRLTIRIYALSVG